jgi:hypothetical protein
MAGRSFTVFIYRRKDSSPSDPACQENRIILVWFSIHQIIYQRNHWFIPPDNKQIQQ